MVQSRLLRIFIFYKHKVDLRSEKFDAVLKILMHIKYMLTNFSQCCYSHFVFVCLFVCLFVVCVCVSFLLLLFVSLFLCFLLCFSPGMKIKLLSKVYCEGKILRTNVKLKQNM